MVDLKSGMGFFLGEEDGENVLLRLCDMSGSDRDENMQKTKINKNVKLLSTEGIQGRQLLCVVSLREKTNKKI